MQPAWFSYDNILLTLDRTLLPSDLFQNVEGKPRHANLCH